MRTTKEAAICGLMLLAALATQAVPPRYVPFQGRLSSTNGVPLADGVTNIVFELYTNQVGGVRVWAETNSVSIVDGRAQVLLGSKTIFAAGFDFNRDLYLDIKPGGLSLGPRQTVIPIIFAQNSAKLAGYDWSALLASGNDPMLSQILYTKIQDLPAAKTTSGTFDVNRIPALDASKVTSGTLNAARIPSLDASKITTGTLGDSRIPSLDASKVISGMFDSGRIPSLDASKVTTGTFDALRIPSLDASKVTSGIFGASRIPSLDASKVTTGILDINRIPSISVAKLTTGSTTASMTLLGGTISVQKAAGGQHVHVGHQGGAGGGRIEVDDNSGGNQITLWVADDNKGYIDADWIQASAKYFVEEHPSRPGYQIMYVCLEGPEAGMYHRGTVRLEKGRATIELPEHFVVLANPATLTVSLTPKSLDSKGVAVASSGRTGRIEIGELFGGTGAYEVDFLVMAVRKGYENHQPVVSKEEFRTQHGFAHGDQSRRAGPSDADRPE